MRLLISCLAVFISAASCDPVVRLIKSFDIAKDSDPYLAHFIREPHPFGSQRQRDIAKLLEQTLQGSWLQRFEAVTPNPAAMLSSEIKEKTLVKTGFNVILEIDFGKPCVYVLASHYDTKDMPGMQYLGANDSASSSVMLIYLSDFLRKNHTTVKNHVPCNIVLVWFDGEESVLLDWYAGEKAHPARIQDNTYGSRHFVEQLEVCDSNAKKHCFKGKEIKKMILSDMIGMNDLKISKDMHSTPQLRQKLENVAQALGYTSYLGTQPQYIEDDHLPFLQVGIPSINIIDFENIYTWHEPNDVSIHYPSLVIAAQLILGMILL